MITPRRSHSSTLLPDGRVLVAGGYSESDVTNSAEIYDPVANTWTIVAGMNVDRQLHTATLLRDGRVLVAGGAGNGGIAIPQADIYNPWTDSWTATGSLSAPRFYASAELLSDGKVLVAGGANGWSIGNILASVEVYNPLTGIWTTIAPMTAPHASHTSTFLLDGRILIASGYNEEWAPSSDTQIYDPGLDYDEAWQPFIISGSELAEGGSLTLTGTGFRGYQYSEAAGSGTYSTPTNLPVVQLRRLDNGLTMWVRASEFSESSYVSSTLWGLQKGPLLVTVIVNGIPSEARLINSGDMLLRLYIPALMK